LSKLTLHLQEIPGWIGNFLDISGAHYIKIIDPPEDDPFPGTRIIRRFFRPDEETNDMIRRKSSGAREFADWILPLCAKRPWLWAVEGPNEPQPMADRGFRLALAEFSARLGDILHSEGVRFVGLNLSVGWPDIGHAPDLGPALAHMDYVGLHEYSAPAMWDRKGYYCLRYRQTIKEWEDGGFAIPPIIIGETGIDGGVLGQAYTKKGWPEFTDKDGYLKQLAWYSGELDKDRIVEAATIFTVCSWDWHSFDIPYDLGMDIAAYIRDHPTPPSSQTQVKSFFLSRFQAGLTLDKLRAAKAAGYLVAHVKASEGANVDPGFARRWDMAGRAGLKRAAFHYLLPDVGGQAATFHRAVGDRDPVAIFGDFEHRGLTLEKCHDFLKHADMRFAEWRARRGRLCDVYTGAWWLDPRGKPPWEAEGRKLWVSDCSGGEKPRLPKAFSTWEWWQHRCGRQIEPFAPIPVCVDRYGGTVADLERDYPDAVPEPPLPGNGGKMKIYDWEGRERDWAWLRGKYGDVQVHVPEGGTTWTACELREDLGGSNTLLVEVRGAPPGTLVTFAWPDGSAQAPTKETGRAEFPMGGGAYYQPPSGGPHRVWVSGGGGSEVVDGLGMLFGSNHHHLNVAFQKGSAPPPGKHELRTRVKGIGAVEATPDKAEYGHGEAVVLEAQETDSGWKFSRWEGDLSGAANPQTLTMDADKDVTAAFAEEGGTGPDVEAAIAECRQIIAHAEAALRYLGA